MTKSCALLITAMLSSIIFGASSDGDDSTEAARIYGETCIICHGEGVGGAPRLGVKSDWAPRLSYGMEELYLNAIEGVGSTMPARGMCLECSDAQLRAVVDHMVGNLKDE